MFTGIVEEIGEVVALERLSGAARLTIRGRLVTSDAAPGDSIAVNGVCLTVVSVAGGAGSPRSAVGAGDAGGTESSFTVDIMRETLVRSGLGTLAAGSPVNLERALTLQHRLGGHLVQGHVDGTGMILERSSPRHDPPVLWEVVRISLPAELARYVVPKGSIAVDGVSLTVVGVDDTVDDTAFTVSLVPTTLDRTTLGRKRPGDQVNLEADVMAKYAERLLCVRAEP